MAHSLEAENEKNGSQQVTKLDEIKAQVHFRIERTEPDQATARTNRRLGTSFSLRRG
jgi:hypothetical protein